MAATIPSAALVPGTVRRALCVGDGDFEPTPCPPLSAGPQSSGVPGVAQHDPCRTDLSHLHQPAAFSAGKCSRSADTRG
jgi:hypothetical protein